MDKPQNTAIEALREQFAASLGQPDSGLTLTPYLDQIDPAGRRRLLETLVDLALERLDGPDAANRLLESNPDLTDELEPLLSRAAGTVRHSRAKLGHQRPPGEKGLHVRCPHCSNPIELVVDAQLESVRCHSCGTDFGLVDEEDGTATRQKEGVTQVAHFKLVERVGMGAFGAVWKAHDTNLDRTVALKIPRRGQLDSHQQKALLREAQNAAQLNHPGVVPVYEVGREGDTLYIVSEFVRGLSLGDWLSGQTPTAREAADLCRKIAESLQHAHERGVVHRDLKPDNIMLGEPDADGIFTPRLMDFGLARREAAEITLTVEGQVLGTPAYMSPEQARGDSNQADARSDVYSLGVILFELLTGDRPFRGNQRMLLHQVVNDEPPNPRKLNSTVPRDLGTVALKCLEKDPDRRYASAGEVAVDLGHWLGGRSIMARPTPTMIRAYRWCRRNPWPAATIGLAAILLISAALGSLSFASHQQVARERAEELRQEAENAAAEAVESFKMAEEAKQSALKSAIHARHSLRQAENERKLAMDARADAEASEVYASSRAKEAIAAQKNSEAVLSFFEDAFTEIEEGDYRNYGSLANFLQQSASRIDDRLADQPLVAARCWTFLGDALTATNDRFGMSHVTPQITPQKAFSRAREILEETAGVDRRTLFQAALKEADFLASNYPSRIEPSAGQSKTGFENLVGVYDRMRDELGELDGDTLEALSRLSFARTSPKAVLPYARKYFDTLQREKGNANHETLACGRHLVSVLQSSKMTEEALIACRDLIDLHTVTYGPLDARTIDLRSRLLGIFSELGLGRDLENECQSLLENLSGDKVDPTEASLSALRSIARRLAESGDYKAVCKCLPAIALQIQTLNEWSFVVTRRTDRGYSGSPVFPSGDDDALESDKLCKAIESSEYANGVLAVRDVVVNLHDKYCPDDVAARARVSLLCSQALMLHNQIEDAFRMAKKADQLALQAFQPNLNKARASTALRETGVGDVRETLDGLSDSPWDEQKSNANLLLLYWNCKNTLTNAELKLGRPADALVTIRAPCEQLSVLWPRSLVALRAKELLVKALVANGELDDAIAIVLQTLRDYATSIGSEEAWIQETTSSNTNASSVYPDILEQMFSVLGSGLEVEQLTGLVSQVRSITEELFMDESSDLVDVMRGAHGIASGLREGGHYHAALQLLVDSTSAAAERAQGAEGIEFGNASYIQANSAAHTQLVKAELLLLSGDAGAAANLLGSCRAHAEVDGTAVAAKSGRWPILRRLLGLKSLGWALYADGKPDEAAVVWREAQGLTERGQKTFPGDMAAISYFLGEVSDDTFIKAAAPQDVPYHWFVIAEKALAEGRSAKAVIAYRTSVASGAKKGAYMSKSAWSALRLQQLGESWELAGDTEQSDTPASLDSSEE